MLAILKPKGRIKTIPEDFVVQEVLADRSVCELTYKTHIEESQSWYTAFIMTKRAIPADAAVREVARQLGVPFANIYNHGRKDAVAVTSQMIVVEGRYVPDFNHEKIWLDYVGPVEGKILPGGHYGNRFSILVRTNATQPPENERFLNLFGEQRFGDGRHDVGRWLLEGKYDEAFSALKSSPMNGGEMEQVAEKHGLSLPEAMFHPEYRHVLDFKVQQWQSYLWNWRALQMRQSDRDRLNVWDIENMHEYQEIWNPTEVNQEFLASLHHFSRPLFVRAENHIITEKDNGFLHEFTLRSGAFATVFMSSLYDLIDVSRAKFET